MFHYNNINLSLHPSKGGLSKLSPIIPSDMELPVLALPLSSVSTLFPTLSNEF